MFITQKFYIASCSCGAQRLFERTATDYLQWVGQSLCRFDQCSDPFFRTKTAYVTVIVLFVVIVFPGFGNVDKIAERIDLLFVEVALNHFVRHKPAGTNKGVGNCFQAHTSPFHSFLVCQETCQCGIFHAFVLPHLAFVAKALFANLQPVAQAVVTRA